MKTKTKKKKDSFTLILNKATRSLTKYIKKIESGRYKLDALSIHDNTLFVTDGRMLIYGEGLRKILPDHEINDIRVPNVNIAIDASIHSGTFDVHHINTPRLKDGPIAFDRSGKAVGFRPDEDVDLYIGEYNPKSHVLVNSKYLNIAADLGITSFKWDSKARHLTGENGLCGIDIVIAAVKIAK